MGTSSEDENAADGSPDLLERSLRAVYESSIVGMAISEDDRIVAANDSFLQLFGYKPEDLEDGGLRWERLTPAEWREPDARARGLMLQGGSSPSARKEYLHRDGTRVQVRIAAAAVSRRPFQWVAVVGDRTAEARYIDAIRKAVAPPELPQPPGVSVHARYYAADHFTGDFYDLFPIPGDDGWALVLGDVAGHGYPAASLAAQARHTVRGASLAEHRPSKVLRMLNDSILHDEEDTAYCTAVNARLRVHGERLHVRLSRGGHPYPCVVRRSGDIQWVETEGLPLGLFADPGLEEDVLWLEPGDVLLLYTDGLIDTRPGSPYSLPRGGLDRILRQLPEASPRTVAEAVLRSVDDHPPGPLDDDIAVVTLGLDDDPPADPQIATVRGRR